MFNMRNKTLSAVATLFALLVWSSVMVACQREMPAEVVSDANTTSTTAEEDIWEPGVVYLKLAKSGGELPESKIMNHLRASSLRSATGGVKLVQVFDISGEYAPAMIREGLDRWYKIEFDENIDVQEVIDDLRVEKSVETVHGEIKLTRAETHFTPLRSGYFPETNHGYADFGMTQDPLLTKQWHYSNEGMADGFTRDADINLFEAWKTTTGDPKVLVAIIDSGVDTEHPDLREAMWTGKGGIHGKNFFNNTFDLDPSYHGTHVAGTVAARSNNSIGVAGIAGGDGKSTTGVRLISCQVYGPDDGKGDAKAAKNDQFAQAFIWAVEQGAVIANCSWGFPFIKDMHINAEYYKQVYSNAGTILQEGIDYFIKYAGNDSEGRPKAGSMMSGGVVIFGAGNDSAVDVDIIPASSGSVIAVGAFDPDFQFSHYSNCGSWIDILAPGGNVGEYINRGILSTVPENFRGMMLGKEPASKYIYPDFPMEQGCYAYANGTSMATPHVTGIAALMVSHFGKSGKLTNTELQKRLLAAIKPYDHETRNISFKGRMGAGYIDAALALSEPEKLAPSPVQKIEVKELGYYDATIAWQAPADKDAHTHVAFSYQVFLSLDEIKDLTKPTAVVYNHERKQGDELTFDFSGLETDKTYHVAIVACDRNGNKANAVHGTFKTKLNHSPEIVNLPTEPFVILDTRPYFVYSFDVKDKDGHQWNYKTTSLPDGVTVERIGNALRMTVIVQGMRGEHSFVLELEDELRGQQKYAIPFSIVDHTAPAPVQKMKNLFLVEGGQAQTIDLSSSFKLAVGLSEISFDVESNNKEVATVEVRGSQLVITPHKEGVATIIVGANDGLKRSTTSFIVRVTKPNASAIQALYPIPAHSYLKILVKSDDETIRVTVTSSTGEKLIENQLQVNPLTHEATLEVDRLVTGVYNLIVETSHSKDKRTFIKN